MSFIAIIELTIGMIFAWLLVSVSAMFIQEWLVTVLAWRSKMLETSINRLTNDPAITRQLYAHPLIKPLHSGKNSQNKPSYIPSSQFSLALMDIIKNSSMEAALIQKTLQDIRTELSALKIGSKTAILAKLAEALAVLQNSSLADGTQIEHNLNEVKGIIRILSAEYPETKPVIEKHFTRYGTARAQQDRQTNPAANGFSSLEYGIQTLQYSSPSLKQALDALTIEVRDAGQKADNQITQTRANIEAWFNSSMDRLSGWYKRRAQLASFLIGLSLALMFNIDSFQIANLLWRDPSVRQIISIQAEEMVRNNPEGSGTIDPNQMIALTMQLNSLNIPVGWIGTPLAANSQGAVFIADNLQQHCSLAPASSIEIWGFQVGSECYPIINTPDRTDAAGWIFKLLGLLVTAAATAQGAPFWFDMLKNVVNIRSAGAAGDARPTKSAAS